MIGQPALVAPPVSAHPGTTGAVARVPLGIEPLSSSSHPSSGVALVRPVPQQASPVRVSIDFELSYCLMTYGQVFYDAVINFPPIVYVIV